MKKTTSLTVHSVTTSIYGFTTSIYGFTTSIYGFTTSIYGFNEEKFEVTARNYKGEEIKFLTDSTNLYPGGIVKVTVESVI